MDEVGLRELDRVHGIDVMLIADLARDRGPDEAATTLAQVSELSDLGVIGVGLGGSEDLFPPEPFVDVFAAARAHGLHTTAHAGEAAGPASIWGALEVLRVERIGHGIRALEDDRLVDELAIRGIPLEVCPTSNVRTGATSSLRHHPIRELVDRGVLVTVNTDDPTLFGSQLSNEYALLATDMGFSREEIVTLARNAVEASWLPTARKRQLLSAQQLQGS